MTAQEKSDFAKEQRPCNYTKVPYMQMDYVFGEMSKTYDQLKCDKCGLFHIWIKRKAKNGKHSR